MFRFVWHWFTRSVPTSWVDDFYKLSQAVDDATGIWVPHGAWMLLVWAGVLLIVLAALVSCRHVRQFAETRR